MLAFRRRAQVGEAESDRTLAGEVDALGSPAFHGAGHRRQRGGRDGTAVQIAESEFITFLGGYKDSQ